MEIKKRLPLITVLFVAVPLFILGAILYVLTQEWVVEHKKDQLETLVQVCGNQLLEIMDDDWQAAARLAGPGADPGAAVWHLDLQGRRLDRNLVPDGSPACLASDQLAALRSGERVLTGLVADPGTGRSQVLWCLPELDERQVVAGILACPMPVDRLDSYTRGIRIGGTGYAYLTDSQGLIISHPDPARIGTMSENQALRDYIADRKVRLAGGSRVSLYQYRGVAKYMAFRVLPDSGWFLVVNQTLDEIEIPVFRILLVSAGAFVIMVLAGVFLSLRLSVGLVRPIDNMIQVVEGIGRGELDRSCTLGGGDELASLGRSINEMARQLTESRQRLDESRRALQQSEERYRCAVEGAQDVIYDWDFARQEVFVSDKFQPTFGLDYDSPADLLDFFRRHSPAEDFTRLEHEFSELMRRHRPLLRMELRIRLGAELVWLLLRGRILWSPLGEALRMSGSLTNIGDRKRKEERIHRLAFYDVLTGLPNRQACLEQAPALLQAFAQDDFVSGFALLDVDDLRSINDSRGHEAGDQVLTVVAERLSFYCQAHPGYDGKPGALYRFGGDEFLLLLPAFSTEVELRSYMDSIFKRVCSAYSIGEKLLYINLSIGVALFPADGQGLQELLRKADTALNVAKAHGKQQCAYYDAPMTAGLNQRLEIESALHRCLDEGLFEVHYQPLVTLKTGRLVGFEALLRMPDSVMGPIGPDVFIPVAEKTGLIHQIGNMVLVQACRQMRQWRDEGLELSYISVNVSPVQFMDPDFLQGLEALCRREACQPEWIQIEITENVLFASFGVVMPALVAMKEAGFRIALDDFGVGYSSLGYLKSLPLHCIKMDKTFVQDIGGVAANLSIARGILNIAEGLDLMVIAEGIEHPGQAEFLEQLGCGMGQGYHFGKAMPSHQARSLLQKA